MKIFGLTGGIATGKSTSVDIFRQFSEVVVFDSDKQVKSLYEEKSFLNQLGEFDTKAVRDGVLQRKYLRKRVFEDGCYRKKLESLVHPVVRKECLALLEETLNNASASLFIADVPLLFENGFDFGQQANLVVATTRETQRQRLINRNKFSDAVVTAILEAQLPIARKVEQGDVVFWNEGDRWLLEHQIKRFIELIL